MRRTHPEVYAPRWAWGIAGGISALATIRAILQLDSPTGIAILNEVAPTLVVAWIFVMATGYLYMIRWKERKQDLLEW